MTVGERVCCSGWQHSAAQHSSTAQQGGKKGQHSTFGFMKLMICGGRFPIILYPSQRMRIGRRMLQGTGRAFELVHCKSRC
jgi:hypothetical protein